MKRFSNRKERLEQKKNRNLGQEADKREIEGTMTKKGRIKIERKTREIKKRKNRNVTRDSTAIDLLHELISKICKINKRGVIFCE